LVAASTDSNPVALLGKPAMTIGGGGEAGNMHSLDEWFDSKDAYRGIQMLILTVLNHDQK
jgi:tripeptide aminopeptidase